MSTDAIKQIIKRAGSDLDFRKLLFNDPQAALTGYELTIEEIDLLKALQPDHFDSTATELEERVSRARVKVSFPWDRGDTPPAPK